MVPLRFLFWNANGRSSVEPVIDVVREHEVDVVVLAEWPSPRELLEGLNSDGPVRFHLPLNLSERLVFLVGAPSGSFASVHDGSGVAIRRFAPPIGLDVTIVALHLPSKRFLSDEEQSLLSTRVARLIERVENDIGHRRTLVIGDLNMNPFEAGVAGSEGFHGVMSRAVADREVRTVVGEERRFFYNPMWSLLGDGSPGPPGTYFYQSSSPVSFFWNTFDQALMRPDLARAFESGDVEIVTSARGMSLLTARGTPNVDVSDHLPIIVTVRVQEFADEPEEPLGPVAGRRGNHHPDANPEGAGTGAD